MVRYKTGGENLRLWVLSQRFLPPIALVIPVFFAYSYFELSDSFPGLILLYTAFALPYVIWMMSGYLEEIPREIEEAALVDGCTPFGVLWRIVVPMARNGIVATAIFAFIYSWNEFLFALVLTRTQRDHLHGADQPVLRIAIDFLGEDRRHVDPGDLACPSDGPVPAALPGARDFVWGGEGLAQPRPTSGSRVRAAHSVTARLDWASPRDQRFTYPA